MKTTDEQKILDYFLGKLDPAEAERFEETLAQTAKMTERAEIIEQELIDDYVRGRLSPNERILFEENYPVTEARREKIKDADYFFATLKQNAVPGAIEKEKKSASVLFSFWTTPGFRLAAVAALLIILTAGGFGIWLLRKTDDVAGKQNELPVSDSNSVPQQQQNQPETMPENKIIAPENAPAANANREANAAPRNRTPNRDNRKTLPEKPAPVTTIAIFALSPATFRSGGEQIVRIPNSVKKITLNLKLPPEAEKNVSYRAEIKTADGETVFSAAAAPTSGGAVNISVPSSQMANRNYIVFLSETSGEAAAEYVFRVVKN